MNHYKWFIVVFMSAIIAGILTAASVVAHSGDQECHSHSPSEFSSFLDYSDHAGDYPYYCGGDGRNTGGPSFAHRHLIPTPTTIPPTPAAIVPPTPTAIVNEPEPSVEPTATTAPMEEPRTRRTFRRPTSTPTPSPTPTPVPAVHLKPVPTEIPTATPSSTMTPTATSTPVIPILYGGEETL